MTIKRMLFRALLAVILALCPSAHCISLSVSNDAGGFSEVIEADYNDRVVGKTVIGSDRLSNYLEGSGGLKESHSISNAAGATAEVGVNISQAEWYSYSYNLWPKEGSSKKASTNAQVAASEWLDVSNASYIQAYADAFNSKGYRTGVSTLISDPANMASLAGYRNLAMASKNEALASQTVDGAFTLEGYIQADASADSTQLKSKPLRFREDVAETSLIIDSGSLEGYSDLASASTQGITASHQVDATAAEQIWVSSEAKSRTASPSQSLKTERAKIETQVEGSLIEYTGSASISSGSVLADQMGRIFGIFTSTASADKTSKTRSSNYGTTYDFDMQARKDASGSYVAGTLGYYVDNVSPISNRIQGAVDASESGDAINVGPGIYFENVQVDKSLDIKGAGSSQTIVDGQQSGSVFTIGEENDPDVDVGITKMTIRGGNCSPDWSFPESAESFGGGILNYGILLLHDTIISDNTADTGGGIANIGGTLNLNGNSVISNNIASRGGGIYSSINSTVNLNDNSRISNNIAYDGGGISSEWNSTVNLNDNSHISNNAAKMGGGVHSVWYSTVNLNDKSYISKNNAELLGGGIYSSYYSSVNANNNSYISSNIAESSGGIFNGWYGTVNLNDNSCISDNMAERNGGISSGDYGTVNLNDDSCISRNIAEYAGGVYNGGFSTLNLNGNSCISENMATFSAGGIYNFAGGTVNLNDSSHISNNIAYRSDGGGILNSERSMVNLNDDSYVSGNTAAFGGGIYNSYQSTANLNDNSYISSNTAFLGGGIYSYDNSRVTLNNSSYISGNDAYEGGGIRSSYYSTVSLFGDSIIRGNEAYEGGGIFSFDNSTVNMNDRSNISSNIAARGGGIFNSDQCIVNLIDGSIEHNNATLPSPSGGGIYNLGTILGNNDIVRNNSPDQIEPTSVDWLPGL